MTDSTFPQQRELPYPVDMPAFARQFAHLPWFIWLDSNYPASLQGRYDILTALPIASVTAWPEFCQMITGEKRDIIIAPPFNLVQGLLHRYQPQETIKTPLPFTGGALGFISYDAGFSLQQLPTYYAEDINLPLLAMGIYDWAIVVDHHNKTCHLVFQGLGNAQQQRLATIMDCLNNPLPLSKTDFSLITTLEPNMTWQEYAAGFLRIQEYIRCGDCYQINFAQRFSAEYAGNLFSCYKQLRHVSPAPFAGYFSFPEGAILSVSPERFLAVRDNQVVTQPIKGTRARNHADAVADKAMIQELLNSEKDQAENVMIVDLLRNDLGKVCKPGSVKVPELFGLKSYSNVHHLVSTVMGELDANYEAFDAFVAAFPGGSITGAPKRRAIEIIAELEPHARGAYCGSLAYFDFNGNMDSSITIRTVVANDKRVFLWGGGGIVADSTAEAEYQETFAKVLNIMGVLEA